MATRDFIFVEDVANGLIACAADGTPGGVYNIASGKETSIADLATKINEITGNNTELDRLPKRPWDNSGKRFGSPEKSAASWGFLPTYRSTMGCARRLSGPRPIWP